MIWYIFKVAVISIFILLLAHYMNHYLKIVCTLPKMKDYVTVSKKHYEKIAELLASQKKKSNETSTEFKNILSKTVEHSTNQIHCPTEEELMIELSEYMNTIIE